MIADIWKNAHLLDTYEPLVRGQDTTANCGRVVRKAEAIAATDYEPRGDKFFPVRCRECLRQSKRRRYLYAIVAGEESLHETEGA